MFRTTVGVEGMKCPRCEARVANAVKENFKVKSAVSDRTKKETEILSKAPLDETKLREVIENEGFSVTCVECAEE